MQELERAICTAEPHHTGGVSECSGANHAQQPRGYHRTWLGMPVLRETWKPLEALVQCGDARKRQLGTQCPTCLMGEL